LVDNPEPLVLVLAGTLTAQVVVFVGSPMDLAVRMILAWVGNLTAVAVVVVTVVWEDTILALGGNQMALVVVLVDNPTTLVAMDNPTTLA